MVVSSPRLRFTARTANQKLFQEAVRHALALEGVKKAEVRRIVALLEKKMIPDLRSQWDALKRVKVRGRTVNVRKLKSLQRFFASTDGIISGAFAATEKAHRSSLSALAISEAEFATAAMASAIPVGLAVEFAVPSVTLLRGIVGAQPFEGQLLGEWYTGLSRKTQLGVRGAVEMGILQGESTRQMASRVFGQQGLLSTTMRQSESIVRTATNHVTTQAREISYRENNNLIQGVQYLATLDSRTTPVCRDLDGTVWPIDDGPRPPQHWACRSTTAPVLKSAEELGLDLDELPPGTRASMNGEVAETQNYGQWLREQPASIQIEALGPRDAGLFAAGRLQVSGVTGA